MRAGVRKSGHGRGYARRPGLAAALALTAAVSVLAACDSGGSSTSSAPPPSSSAPSSSTTFPAQLPPQTLTLGVVGGPDEVAAYEQMAELYAPLNRQVTVKVESWPSAGAMVQAFEEDLQDGKKLPDVFLVSRRYLPWMLQNQAIQPIDQLLDERDVDFGD